MIHHWLQPRLQRGTSDPDKNRSRGFIVPCFRGLLDTQFLILGAIGSTIPQIYQQNIHTWVCNRGFTGQLFSCWRALFSKRHLEPWAICSMACLPCAGGHAMLHAIQLSETVGRSTTCTCMELWLTGKRSAVTNQQNMGTVWLCNVAMENHHFW